jgi:transposase-like protein
VAYSSERKASVIAKMLSPHSMPLQRLPQEEGISIGTLSRWRAEARARGRLLPDGQAGPEGWTARDKFAAVIGEPLRRHRFETNGDRGDECSGAVGIL